MNSSGMESRCSVAYTSVSSRSRTSSFRCGATLTADSITQESGTTNERSPCSRDQRAGGCGIYTVTRSRSPSRPLIRRRASRPEVRTRPRWRCSDKWTDDLLLTRPLGPHGFDRGNLAVVRNKLNDAISTVNAQSGKSNRDQPGERVCDGYPIRSKRAIAPRQSRENATTPAACAGDGYRRPPVP